MGIQEENFIGYGNLIHKLGNVNERAISKRTKDYTVSMPYNLGRDEMTGLYTPWGFWNV